MSFIESLKEKFGFSDDTLGNKISLEEKFEARENAYKFAIAGLILGISLMGFGYVNSTSDKYAVVEIPGTIYAETPLKVGNGWTNDMLMKVWADWILNTTSNVSASDVKDKFNQCLRVFAQEKVGLYATQLGALSDMVIRNQLKQQFTTKTLNATYYSDTDFKNKTDGQDKVKSAEFEYKGVATQTINNSLLPDKQCGYKISMVFNGGHLYINTYNTDCFN